jgi:hypothetical protein
MIIATTLEDLAKEIHVRLVKSKQYDTKADDLVHDLRQKAEDQRIAAGLLLIEARKRVEAGEAGDISWTKWCSQNVNRSKGDIRKIMQIAGHVEPKKALAAERAATQARMAEHRAHANDVRAVSPENTVELPADDETRVGKDGVAQPSEKRSADQIKASIRLLPIEELEELKQWFREYCGGAGLAASPTEVQSKTVH